MANINKLYLGDEIVFGNGDEPSSEPSVAISFPYTFTTSPRVKVVENLVSGSHYKITFSPAGYGMFFSAETGGTNHGRWDSWPQREDNNFFFTADSTELWMIGSYTVNSFAIEEVPNAKPAAVTSLSANRTSPTTETSITWSWTGTTGSYAIRLKSGSNWGNLEQLTTASKTYTGLDTGQSYEVEVFQKSDDGWYSSRASSSSIEIQGTYTGEGTLEVPGIPFTVTAGSNLKVVSGLDNMKGYTVTFAPTEYSAYLAANSGGIDFGDMGSSPKNVPQYFLTPSGELWINFSSGLTDYTITAFDVQEA